MPGSDAANPGAPVSATLRELAWTIHRRVPERAGIGPFPTTEIALLKQVVEHPGSTVGELAVALGVKQPNVSAALRVLLARGLVTREAHPHDRRVARIEPTPLAVKEHAEIASAWAGSVDAAIESLDAGDIAALEAAATALQRLEQAIRARLG